MSTFLSTGQIASMCNATCIGSRDVHCTGVFHDTRVPCDGGLYVAIVGAVHDGHGHVEAAVKAGAVAVLVERPVVLPDVIVQLLVPNSRAALRAIARQWRRSLIDIQVIGVTGTAGKTTTKDLLHSIAIAGKGGVASPRSFNNDLGVPLTVLGARGHHHVLIAEVGTSSPGEIAPLAALLKPDVAIITCIGAGHLEGLGSIDAVRAEKYALAAATSNIVFQGYQGFEPPQTSANVETFGIDPAADHLVSDRFQTDRGMMVRVDGQAWPAPLPGRHGALNVGGAVCAAKAVGCSDEAILKGLSSATITPGRFGVMDLGDLTVVDDTWNSNPASVAASLEAIEELAAGRPIGLVLGAMLELGSETERAHRQLGALVQRLASRSTLESLVLVGQPFKGVLDTFPQLAVYVPSASEEFAVMAASHVAHSGHVVLVKGSRSFKLERVIEQLQTDSEEHRPRRTMSN